LTQGESQPVVKLSLTEIKRTFLNAESGRVASQFGGGARPVAVMLGQEASEKPSNWFAAGLFSTASTLAV
jgi:hypothetical protein